MPLKDNLPVHASMFLISNLGMQEVTIDMPTSLSRLKGGGGGKSNTLREASGVLWPIQKRTQFEKTKQKNKKTTTFFCTSSKAFLGSIMESNKKVTGDPTSFAKTPEEDVL